VALHRRKLHISAAGKILYFMTRVQVALPQLLGEDFVVNFATYTRVYTVLTVRFFPKPTHLFESLASNT